MTSNLLHEAYERVSDPGNRSRIHLAVNSFGMKTHPTGEDVVAFSTVGTLMRSLDSTQEDGSPPRLKSLTQKLFFSNAYSYLSQSAKALGFKSISMLDEFGSEEQWQKMWDDAIMTALMFEVEKEGDKDA